MVVAGHAPREPAAHRPFHRAADVGRIVADREIVAVKADPEIRIDAEKNQQTGEQRSRRFAIRARNAARLKKWFRCRQRLSSIRRDERMISPPTGTPYKATFNLSPRRKVFLDEVMVTVTTRVDACAPSRGVDEKTARHEIGDGQTHAHQPSAALDRPLDADNTSVTLQTMGRAAAVWGRNSSITLKDAA